jgi:hypothetical protein
MRTLLILLCLLPNLSAQPREAVVKVASHWYVQGPDEVPSSRNAYGTGVVIFTGTTSKDQDFSLILTNGHVVEDEDSDYTVLTPGPKKNAADVIAHNDKNDSRGDLALLKVWVKLPSAKLAKTDPPKDATVYQWGHPGAGRLDKREGRFLGGVDGHWYGDYLVIPGCSGSAVCYNEEVIGLCSASSFKRDVGGNIVYQADGKTPVLAPPMHMVARKVIENFLFYHAAADMGYTVEKAPMPRVVSRP